MICDKLISARSAQDNNPKMWCIADMTEPLSLDIEELQQQLQAERQRMRNGQGARQEIDRLRAIIHELQRHRFGRRSEQLDPDQLALALEEVEQTCRPPRRPGEEPACSDARPAQRRKINRGACPRTCRGSRWWSTSPTRPVRAAAGEDAQDRRGRVASGWTWCRPSSGCSWRAGPSTPAGLPGTVVQAPAPARLIESGLPTEALVARSSSPSTPTTFRSIGRPRSTPARGSASTARRSPTGWAGVPGGCGRCTPGCSTSCVPRPSCSPTRRRPRCSIPAEGGPRPASSGHMRATIGRGADRPAGGRLCLRAGPQGRRPAAHLEGFRGILQVDGYAGYRALATKPARSNWRSAGAMSDGPSTRCGGRRGADRRRGAGTHRRALCHRG